MNIIDGFSRLDKKQKIQWLASQNRLSDNIEKKLQEFWHPNPAVQKLFEDFSENTVSNFYMPYGLAPNFLIDGKTYCVPMVIEESSVIAAAAKSAKFWQQRGGFVTKILGTEKRGHIYFKCKMPADKVHHIIAEKQSELIESCLFITQNMKQRGGGIKQLAFVSNPSLSDLFILEVSFETCDAMGANFINSVLEFLSKKIEQTLNEIFKEGNVCYESIMCILSNYTPNCTVQAEVTCSISELGSFNQGEMSSQKFAQKFKDAIDIATYEPSRAVTHNKGIMNGIDAVVLATGNDFRAIEACAHAFAARNGVYQSLSYCRLDNDQFIFGIQLPLSLGTIGGLTALHPLAKLSLEILGRPSATQLMSITAAVGLAQNFAAIKSLVTSGIQKGHMKMHLLNILRQFGANEYEINQAKIYFQKEIVSYPNVRDFLSQLPGEFH